MMSKCTYIRSAGLKRGGRRDRRSNGELNREKDKH